MILRRDICVFSVFTMVSFICACLLFFSSSRSGTLSNSSKKVKQIPSYPKRVMRLAAYRQNARTKAQPGRMKN